MFMMMMTVAVLFSGNNSFISFGKKTKEKKFTIKSQTDDDEEKMFFHLSLFLHLFVCCYLCHSQYSNGHKFHPWIKKMLFCRLSNEFSQHRMEKNKQIWISKSEWRFHYESSSVFFRSYKYIPHMNCCHRQKSLFPCVYTGCTMPHLFQGLKKNLKKNSIQNYEFQ